ncbi:MAG TPA: hypothetical protein VFN57_13085 [Thermomicrobiaceae bacterium]|nr:hypothetical protein [Thermomicrobiaceae bacterium]
MSAEARRPGLALTRLEVRRTPGIANPFALDGLSPGINLIYGPNASGKTTTAQTIQSVLWPRAPVWSRGSYRGHYRLDGSDWVVDFDAGSLRCQRDGRDDAPSSAVDPDLRSRYVLTLPQLLAVDDDPSFAATILRESAGGYDLPAAVAELGYRTKLSRPAREVNELKRARAAVREARRAQTALAARQDELAELRARRAAAEKAASRAERLRAALALRDAERQLREATEALADFPAALEHCMGDELERVAGVRQELDAVATRRAQAERTRDEAQRVLEAGGLAGAALAPGLVASLRARAHELQQRANMVEAGERALRQQETHRDEARRRIDAQLSDAQIRALDAGGLSALADLARRLAETGAERAGADDVAAWIGGSEPAEDPDRLAAAIRWLELWLRSPETAERVAGERAALIATLASALVAVEAATLAVLVSRPFALLALAGVALLVLARRAGPGAGTGRAELVAEEYGKLGLEPPARWQVPEVESLAATLVERRQRALLARERAQRWAGLEERRAALRDDEARLAEEVARARATFGAVPGDFASLAVLAAHLQAWQGADSRAREEASALELERSRHRALLAELNAALAGHGYVAAVDHVALLALVDDLDRRVTEATAARDALDGAERALVEEIGPEQARRAEAVRAFFAALALAEDDDDGLRGLLARFDDYRAARTRADDTATRARLAAERLGDAGDLAGLGEPELRAELRAEEDAAGSFDETNEQIIAIETRVADAKRGRDLETALLAEGDALDALRGARDEEERLIAGWVLGEAVRERTRDLQRPRVFHRARELFARITQGRYRLEIEDERPPRFRATDTTTGLSAGLDELSSATRVQLLIAVRVAFVEEMEQGPRLPLILDEALGNSDEQRARAIIEAAIAIARSGRQVFYFTAQHDEVGKWLAVLGEQPDVPHVAINLSEVRGLADVDRLPPRSALAPAFPSVPLPDGLDHEDYGLALRVPGLDPRGDVGAVHLWYLEDDPARLHALLARGVTTWGQLRTLVELGGDRLLGDVTATARVAARARLLEAAFAAWRIGRPPRVDRAAIAAADAISPAFVERVAELNDELDGSGPALVAALREGAVARLQRPRIDRLAEELAERGYLDDAAPLSAEDLRVHVLAAVAGDIASGAIEAAEVARAVSRLPDLAGLAVGG